MRPHDRIIAALDVPGPAAAAALAARLAGHVGMYKVGLELFVAHGRGAVDAVRPFAIVTPSGPNATVLRCRTQLSDHLSVIHW